MIWERLVEPIRSDKTAGAAELAKRAAAAVLQWVDRSEARSLSAWTAELTAFGRALYQAQSSMAPLFNLVNHLLLAVQPARTLPQARHSARGAAQAFLRQLEHSQETLIAAALPLMLPAARILTFSYSSTVLAVLVEARAQQIPLAVFCTEGRPMLEGQRLALQLAHAGVEVDFGVDAALSSFASQASLVLLGADSVTREGVVNKLGTTGVALAARMARVPCYVLCGREKWFPAAATPLLLSQPQPMEEVWGDPPNGVKVWNVYFEYTPLDLLTGIIAEEGVLVPGEVAQRLTAMPLAAALTPPSHPPPCDLLPRKEAADGERT